MRAPKRRRPQRRTIGSAPQDTNLVEVAERASYIGSPEHKTFPSFAGPPAPRADASKCDPSIRDPEVVTGWLRSAILAGRVSGLWEGDFPRNVWARVNEVPYEARLVNREQGTYKGWPLKESEWLSISGSREVDGGAE